MRTLGLLAALLTLGGCASGPQEVPFIDQNSEALNIANQTDLVQNGSKLRDFTPEEIEAAKASLEKNTGSASTTIGVFKILTGNWMGALDVAGGAVAGFAMDDHTSGQSRWIIAVDAAQYINGLEAKQSTEKIIQTTARQILEEKGNSLYRVPIEQSRESVWGGKIEGHHGYVLSDHNNRVLGFTDWYRPEIPMDKAQSLLNTNNKQYVALNSHIKVDGGQINPASFILGDVKGYQGEEGYDQFLKDLTARLPNGFYYYTASYEKVEQLTLKSGKNWDCDDSRCANYRSYRTHKSVPSIYTQGRRLDFIKPQS